MTIWPIYVLINVLTFKARKNILSAGIWVDTEEPGINLLLQPFINNANILSKRGIEYNVNLNQIIKAKILPLICSVDSVTTPKILTMKQYNGYYGCKFCKHPTENVEGCKKYPISYTTLPPLHTDTETNREMLLAGSTDQWSVNGAKGPSSLMNLNYFGLVEGMIPDPMHALFLGVVSQHTTILLTSPNEEYYIGFPSKVAIINKT